MLFWFALWLSDGGTPQSLLQTSTIRRMCLLSRWQNKVQSVPETAVNSTAGMFWLPGFLYNIQTGLFYSPEVQCGSHMLATCSGLVF